MQAQRSCTQPERLTLSMHKPEKIYPAKPSPSSYGILQLGGMMNPNYGGG